MRLARLFPPDLITVARVQHRMAPWRAPMAVLLGALSAPALGWARAGAWLAFILACELWTWLVTKPSVGGRMSPGQLAHYVLSGAFTVPGWTALGVLFWLSGVRGAAEVALALWAAQLIYTQRFIYQSVLAIVVGNASTVSATLALPLLIPRHAPAIQAPLMLAIVVGVAFAISGAVMTLNTVRQLAREKAAVEHGATHDALTGLMNRELFQRRLAEAVGAAERCAILFLDLDRFKQVNDMLGHQSGDALLQEFARRLLASAPAGASVARFGGDEFAILTPLPGGRDEAERLSRAVIAAAEAPFGLPRGHAHVGASVGVCLSPDEGRDAGELMRKADIALYAAKAAGRADFRVFTDELDVAVRARAELEQDLRAVLASGEGLQLHYQPKMACDGRSLSVEALLRWDHPALGPVSPARIIAVAEETGLILPLGAWVFREALAFAARWPALGVAINVSPAQLQHADFADWAAAHAAACGVEAGRMELEVTETVLLEDSGPTAQTLGALRAAGFGIALDDFGTGYSSLRHLHRFAVDRVKIDQSFVRHLESSTEAAAIIQAVIQLGHAMGLQVTAEGVETRDHRDFLSRAGVDEMQGFLFSAAVPEGDLAAFFTQADHARRRAA